MLDQIIEVPASQPRLPRTLHCPGTDFLQLALSLWNLAEHLVRGGHRNACSGVRAKCETGIVV